MSCEEFLKIVATKTLLEVPKDERREVMNHLHHCKVCKKKLSTETKPMTKFEHEGR